MLKTLAIRAFSKNLCVLRIASLYHKLIPELGGVTVFYRVREIAEHAYQIQGFRASMADGVHKRYDIEHAECILWVGAKRLVFNNLNTEERNSNELIPLVQHFREAKYEEFFIDEDRPVFEMTISAAVLEEMSATDVIAA